ncbi:hypothetical protein BX600DRAFT_512142 [Xylariales sp. PMI_506]|nr:hypothetical protein BX600DRAFT_512142 [Xylariales sp. PMI_506]
MTAIRITNSLRAARNAQLRIPQNSYRFFTAGPRLSAQQGGQSNSQGDNLSENPQDATPPDVGKGAGSAGPTKAAFSASMEQAAGHESGGSQSQGGAKNNGPRAASDSGGGGNETVAKKASRKGGEALKGPKGKDAPQPKIFNQAIPGAREGLSEEQKREVEEHNREFEKRHDRAAPAGEDKVNKKFWQGQ